MRRAASSGSISMPLSARTLLPMAHMSRPQKRPFSPRSITATDAPLRAAAWAVPMPAMPPPTTTISKS